MGDTFNVLKRKSKPKFNKEKSPPAKQSGKKQTVRVTSRRRASSERTEDRRTQTRKARAKRTLYEDTINVVHTESAKTQKATSFTISEVQSKKRTKKIAWGVFAGILVTVLVCILIWGSFLLFFKVESISCEGITLYEEEAIIASSGIEIGQNMYQIDRDRIVQDLCAQYPYLLNVRIIREIPTGIVIKAEEDQAAFYATVGNEYCLLSAQMRVLELTDDEKGLLEQNKDLRKLVLPPISAAIVGNEIEFINEKNKDYVEQVISTVRESEYADRIREINLKSKFEISFYYDGRIEVLVGEAVDIPAKIRFAFAIIGEFSENATGTVSAESVESGYAIVDDPGA